MISFVGISWFNWIGHVNRMDSKGKVSEVCNNNPQGSRLRGRPKTGGGTVYKQILTLERRSVSVLYKDSVRTAL
jgi:hypothetical protein